MMSTITSTVVLALCFGNSAVANNDNEVPAPGKCNSDQKVFCDTLFDFKNVKLQDRETVKDENCCCERGTDCNTVDVVCEENQKPVYKLSNDCANICDTPSCECLTPKDPEFKTFKKGEACNGRWVVDGEVTVDSEVCPTYKCLTENEEDNNAGSAITCPLIDNCELECDDPKKVSVAVNDVTLVFSGAKDKCAKCSAKVCVYPIGTEPLKGTCEKLSCAGITGCADGSFFYPYIDIKSGNGNLCSDGCPTRGTCVLKKDNADEEQKVIAFYEALESGDSVGIKTYIDGSSDTQISSVGLTDVTFEQAGTKFTATEDEDLGDLFAEKTTANTSTSNDESTDNTDSDKKEGSSAGSKAVISCVAAVSAAMLAY